MPISRRARSRIKPGREALPSSRTFRRAFGVGRADRILAVDACGVVLAAIQGLHAELARLDREIERLRRHTRPRPT